MEAKHTPGPWICIRHGAITGGPLVEYVNGHAQPQVAMATLHESISVEERDANALLIAAAPDLLDFIKTLENDDNKIPAWLWEKRNALIAKAEGRDQ